MASVWGGLGVGCVAGRGGLEIVWGGVGGIFLGDRIETGVLEYVDSLGGSGCGLGMILCKSWDTESKMLDDEENSKFLPIEAPHNPRVSY
ncbi:hypothetical protein Tco_0714285 [Tanacetum coccineum]